MRLAMAAVKGRSKKMAKYQKKNTESVSIEATQWFNHGDHPEVFN